MIDTQAVKFEFDSCEVTCNMLLQPGAKLEEEEAKRIFQQVLSAMDYCHRR